jgi:PBP1b-binding outer membrane lipoprotein LpoB
MFSRSRLCTLVAAALLLGACAAAPVQTMSDTRQTIKAAEAAGAAQLAPDSLTAARDGLKRAEAAIRSGDYRSARREAAAARQSAADALAATQRSAGSN